MTLGATAYVLCFAAALACAALLTRAYRNSRFRLLFWSAVCFWGLTVTNALTVVDLVLITNRNLYGFRLTTGLLSVLVLLYGMVWEADSR
jgi:hypothetical protein